MKKKKKPRNSWD